MNRSAWRALRRPLQVAFALIWLISAGCVSTAGPQSSFAPFASNRVSASQDACPAGQVTVCRVSGIARAGSRQRPEDCGCGEAPSVWNDVQGPMVSFPARNSTP